MAMAPIRNVAIIGATGRLGQQILTSLLSTQLFKITVLTRGITPTTFPPSVQVIPLDYTSIPALCEALCAQEALIITLGNSALELQNRIIDAAIIAGVRRIIPSEFSANTEVDKTAMLPGLVVKEATRGHIQEKIRDGVEVSYTCVLNGLVLDLGVEPGGLLDWRSGKAVLYDGGEREFSACSISSVGMAVVGVLVREDETRNRCVRVHDVVISQKRMLELAMEARPDKNWEVVNVGLVDVEERDRRNLERGDWSTIHEYMSLATFGEGYGAKFEVVDNELLGIKGWSENDVGTFLKNTLR